MSTIVIYFTTVLFFYCTGQNSPVSEKIKTTFQYMYGYIPLCAIFYIYFADFFLFFTNESASLHFFYVYITKSR